MTISEQDNRVQHLGMVVTSNTLVLVSYKVSHLWNFNRYVITYVVLVQFSHPVLYYFKMLTQFKFTEIKTYQHCTYVFECVTVHDQTV